jgi:hypothetical protein
MIENRHDLKILKRVEIYEAINISLMAVDNDLPNNFNLYYYENGFPLK